MGRSTPSAVTTPFRAESPEPVWLLHVVTGGTPANVYVTSYDGAVAFAGLTFTPRPLEVEEVALEDQSEAPTLSIRLGDADAYWQTLLAAGCDFVGRRVTLYRTDASAVGTGSAATDSIYEVFLVHSWKRVEGGIQLVLRSLLAVFDQQVPISSVTRREFPGMPDRNRT